MKLYKYTEEELRAAVKENKSIRQVLLVLGVDAFGGNYETFKRAVKHFDIDTSHFMGQAANKGRNFGPKRPIEAYLDNSHAIASAHLRNRLLREKIRLWKCEKCKLENWFKEQIPLELHHVNKDNKDNRLDNLKILCPNCHTLEHRKKLKTPNLTHSGTVQIGSLKTRYLIR